ncbi:tRNA A64-2'-O-ribosylphosphate transferase [Lipomyces oligophaga]|uniref:tRNA A64-2'-O-ribosylphosphate transferase n=1 Tax=Lipomyces oligophaga TaxID=45792 RepID=UPI0034CEC426
MKDDSFSQISKELRKESRSIRNRLHSISEDAEFVSYVSSSFRLPLVVNERCGRWYIRPEDILDSVYFKSTDGHTGQWGFSIRRINLHLLDIIMEHKGIIIVDSTRRGKRMPDALSKTIPIWCCVLNAVLFGVVELYTPPGMVSRSEHDQICCRIPGWAELLVNSGIDIDKVKLDKPLRPIWVTPEHGDLSPPSLDGVYPIVLCTASQLALDGSVRTNGYVYVQGAADDHEEWASVITPAIFWKNRNLLLSLTDAELDSVIENRDFEAEDQTVTLNVCHIEPTKIYIGHPTPDLNISEFDIIINLSMVPLMLPAQPSAKIFEESIPAGKRGSKIFRKSLVDILDFLRRTAYCSTLDIKLLILSDSGSDFNVATALAVMTVYYEDPSGQAIRETDTDHNHKTQAMGITKDMIRKRLTTIVTQVRVNPSRASLQAVNAVLMGWQ